MKRACWGLVLTTLFVLSDSSSELIEYTETGSCVCGRIGETAARIVGGRAAVPHAYPWMVMILYKGRTHCGGSVINDRYVLTAGHCFHGLNKEKISVLVGIHDLNNLDGQIKQAEMEVESATVYEDYKVSFRHDVNDIGLIKLKQPLKFSSTVSPVCLPKPDQDFKWRMATVMGWGKEDESGTISNVLKQTELKVLSNEQCRKIEYVGEHILDNMLCAIGVGTDACQGDSGGPLIYVERDGTAKVIGLVSWGIGCAKPGLPGIYTRVSSFVEWIHRNTQDGIYCTVPDYDSESNQTRR